MDLTLLGVLGIVSVIVLIFLGVNLGLAMAAVGFVCFALATNFSAAFGLFRTVPFTNAVSYSLSVIPLFILMGQFAYYSGISHSLYDATDKWLSRMKGGQCVATIATAAGFAAICGSATATAATLGTLALPSMRKYNYDDGLSAACIAAGGGIGILIPPSTAFIVYAMAATQSVGRLFAAGIMPGLLLTTLYIITIQIICAINPKLAPSSGVKYSWGEKFKSLLGALPIGILFIIVIGGIFAGIFTANEAAAIGALAGLIITALKRRLTVKILIQALVDSIKVTAMIFMIFIGAYIFGYFLTVTMIPKTLAGFVAGLQVRPYIVICVIMLVYLGLGCIMDTMAMVLLTVPIFLPIVEQLGFDPVWFGVMIVIMMQQGAMTPPVGMNVYVVAGIARDIPMPKIFKGCVPFVIAVFVAALLILVFPQIALWLPNLIYE